MRYKIVVSIIMTLLMVVSTFAVGTVNIKNTGDQECNDLEVIKEVKCGSDWLNECYANVEDTLTYRITFTYESVCGYELTDIVVTDVIDPVGSITYLVDFSDSTYQPDSYEGKYVWNLTDDHGIILNNGQSVSILFNVTITGGHGEIINSVEVDGLEHCCGVPMEGSDSATIIVEETEELGISIDKELYDEDSDEYIEDSEGAITIYKEEDVEFRINVTNTGNVDLEDVIVKDVLPDCLIYDSASDSPDYDGDLNLTWTFDLAGGETKYLYIYMSVCEELDEVVCCENYVNVTAVEPDCVCDCECLFDEDTFEICVKPHIIVEKKVWNEDEWADKIEHVTKSENVRFKITTTYYGERTMKCLLVFDDLPDCLGYLETTSIKVAGEQISTEDIKIYIGDDETKEICGHEFILHEGYIIWDWIDTELGLKDGESVEIIFETEVTEYCEECDCVECQPDCWDENCAMALLWGCCPCHYYMEDDCVDVMCCPPPTTFEKKVREKGENTWEDSVETTVGESLEFKLELEYHGEENLTGISFKDELPCILEYANNVDYEVINGDAVLDPIELSSNEKTVWFNFTGNLTDSGKITITFDVNVIGSTGDCPDCELNCYNYASMTGYRDECQCPQYKLFMEDTADISAETNCPPEAQGISGPSSGKEGDELTFESTITDPNNDMVYYKFKVVGGTETSWTGPVSSGTVATLAHTFEEAGTYQIKVKAKDEHGLESGWDESLDIVISKETPESEITIIPPSGLINIKTLTAAIENTGTTDLTDIVWNFNISKSGLLGNWEVNNNGTMDLEEGAKQQITSREVPLLKFGKVTVKITADNGEASDTYSGTGFVLFGIILLM